MKILYVAPKYDYGKHERGLSFEHYNFFDSLYNMGNEIIYFDYLEILKKIGKRRMNELLLTVVEKEKPELMFVFLFEHELDPNIISKISNSGKVKTINWFADDHWRFDNYSKYWAPHFNWSVTTDFEAVPKYKNIGYSNIILSQWACNHFLYKNIPYNPAYDVSFIGMAYKSRRDTIGYLKQAGIDVVTRGQGWISGRANQDEMIEIINRSRINLNLSNASIKYAGDWLIPIDRIALYNPLVKRIWRKARSYLQLGATKAQPILQIKGRNFEIPGCGGFLITEYVQGLDEYFQPDKEIVCYNSKDELVEKVKYYLQHESSRKLIALNGLKATLDKHTYVHRFNYIFQRIGLKNDFTLEKQFGSCKEII